MENIILFMGDGDTVCSLPKCSLPRECFSSVSTWKTLGEARKWASIEIYIWQLWEEWRMLLAMQRDVMEPSLGDLTPR